jgi:cytochrome c oxidase subunit III
MKSAIYARRDPYVMMLWLGILGSVIIFVFLSLLYLIRKENPGWYNFEMPRIFWLSTVAIVMSSFSLAWANRCFARERFSRHRYMLGATFVLGIIFCISQVMGWKHLQDSGVLMEGSVSASFLYIFSGLHLLHILGGILVLFYALTDAIRNGSYIDSYIQSLNPVKMSRLRLVSIYWHFVDFLWIYLFGFFLYHYR